MVKAFILMFISPEVADLSPLHVRKQSHRSRDPNSFDSGPNLQPCHQVILLMEEILHR